MTYHEKAQLAVVAVGVFGLVCGIVVGLAISNIQRCNENIKESDEALKRLDKRKNVNARYSEN